MDLGFVFGLGAITLAVVGALLFFGLKLSKSVNSRAPNSHFAVQINLSGTVLFACLVAFWIICMVARQNFPSSSFGSFLRDAEGFAITILFSVLSAGVIAAALEYLGHPVIRNGADDA